MNFKKGKFKPKNWRKYKGNPTNIVYRSSWELKAMKYFDLHNDVIQWSSEETIVPYVSPIDNKVHRYFVDFVVTRVDKYKQIKTYMVEVKPFAQTLPPKGKKKTARLLQEAMTYEVNLAKWAAAEEYCKKKGWTFMILTEKNLKV